MNSQTKPVKKVSVYVLRNAALSGATNGGATETQNEFTLYETLDDYNADTDRSASAPPLILRRRNLAGGEYLTAYPLIEGASHASFMMGGNFVYTSDSRFREYFNQYPIPVHDRREGHR